MGWRWCYENGVWRCRRRCPGGRCRPTRMLLAPRNELPLDDAAYERLRAGVESVNGDLAGLAAELGQELSLAIAFEHFPVEPQHPGDPDEVSYPIIRVIAVDAVLDPSSGPGDSAVDVTKESDRLLGR